jgi:hypothetical protein
LGGVSQRQEAGTPNPSVDGLPIGVHVVFVLFGLDFAFIDAKRNSFLDRFSDQEVITVTCIAYLLHRFLDLILRHFCRCLLAADSET